MHAIRLEAFLRTMDENFAYIIFCHQVEHHLRKDDYTYVTNGCRIESRSRGRNR